MPKRDSVECVSPSALGPALLALRLAEEVTQRLLPEADRMRQDLDDLVGQLDALRRSLADLHPLVRMATRTRLGAIEIGPEYLKSLGNTYRQIREACRLTQIQIAQIAGLSNGTVKNFELAKYGTTARNMGILLRVMLQIAQKVEDVPQEAISTLRDALQLVSPPGERESPTVDDSSQSGQNTPMR